jgi:hypothetical protein
MFVPAESCRILETVTQSLVERQSTVLSCSFGRVSGEMKEENRPIKIGKMPLRYGTSEVRLVYISRLPRQSVTTPDVTRDGR